MMSFNWKPGLVVQLGRVQRLLLRRASPRLQLAAAAAVLVCVVLVVGCCLLHSSSTVAPPRWDRAVHFTSDGRGFVVEGAESVLLSGALHYFRVVPAYWEDRLRRLQAAGLNTVETYVPWNLHEPLPGHFDFSGILDVQRFITTAQQLGLHVIVRPGPYICAEWELGGLPAWLLHDPHMALRSTYPPYLEAVERYFERLFGILAPLQSSRGGPIIAMQLENELAHFSSDTSRPYLTFLYKLYRRLGVEELLFTSDGGYMLNDSLALRPSSEVLLTINFQKEKGYLQALRQLQPDKPLMVMEFWSGWFDHWGDPHLARNIEPHDLAATLHTILSAGASINFYMFHGGTNFGFMNGGNWGEVSGVDYQPTVTSYDYDAPVSEAGDIMEKYRVIRDAILELASSSLRLQPLPAVPQNPPKQAYGEAKLSLYLPLLNTLQYIPEPQLAEQPLAMEYLELNGGWGQAYGYTLYRSLIPASSQQLAVHGLKDFGVVLVDYKPVTKLAFFDVQSIVLPQAAVEGSGQVVLDILVENAGRVNYGAPLESRKGITGSVELDGKPHTNWKIYSFEFKSSFVENVESGGLWQHSPAVGTVGPALFKGSFKVPGQPQDTFVDLRGWGKGLVFVNGAHLGRYWSTVGPQQTLYLPAPLLHRGTNKIMLFEFHRPKSPHSVSFRDTPILDS